MILFAKRFERMQEQKLVETFSERDLRFFSIFILFLSRKNIQKRYSRNIQLHAIKPEKKIQGSFVEIRSDEIFHENRFQA